MCKDRVAVGRGREIVQNVLILIWIIKNPLSVCMARKIAQVLSYTSSVSSLP